MVKKGHIPMRSCVSCGQKRPRHELWRFVAQEGIAVWDQEMKRPGRGAYVCKSQGCISLLPKKRKALSKTLKRDIRGIEAPEGLADGPKKLLGG